MTSNAYRKSENRRSYDQRKESGSSLIHNETAPKQLVRGGSMLYQSHGLMSHGRYFRLRLMEYDVIECYVFLFLSRADQKGMHHQ